MPKMTLYEFVRRHPDIDELTVWDKDYDIEFYMYYDMVKPTNKWDSYMAAFAKKLTVVQEKWGSGVVVNLTKVIRKNMRAGTIEHLFGDGVDEEYIICNMPSILAGNVSEAWLGKFVSSLV